MTSRIPTGKVRKLVFFTSSLSFGVLRIQSTSFLCLLSLIYPFSTKLYQAQEKSSKIHAAQDEKCWPAEVLPPQISPETPNDSQRVHYLHQEHGHSLRSGTPYSPHPENQIVDVILFYSGLLLIAQGNKFIYLQIVFWGGLLQARHCPGISEPPGAPGCTGIKK